jgi:hypothetical protein
VSGLKSTVFTTSDAGLWSPFTAHCTNKPDGRFGKSVIVSLLRALWELLAAPNAKGTLALQSSGINKSCSAPSTVCMSAVPSVLCALSSGELAFEEKAESACDVSSNWVGLGWVGFSLCVNCGSLP